MSEEKKTCAGLYEKWKSDREPFLRRARECSKLTIPYLVVEEGHGSHTHLPTPWQGIGARGVNNLASKLLLALLPPNSPFFRLGIDDFTLEKLTQQEGMRAEVEKGLNKIERAVMSEIEGNALRVSSFEALKQLIVSGNVLLYLPPSEGGMRVFHLDRFVCRRDPMGHVLDIITEEEVSLDALPEDVQEFVSEENSDKSNKDKDIKLYTHIYRDGKKWKVYQEVKGKRIPGSEGSYPLEKSPWIPVRWTKIDGESYGRGYVEEYLGDLKSLEGLSQSIVESSAAAAKVLFLVSPNGVTDKATLAEAENGDIVEGMEQDVSVLQLQKYNDLRVAESTAGKIEERLAYAFLLNSAVQRNGERVTAEEIRYMAGELEDALGGIYSILSQEFQLPLVNRIMYQMERQKKMPSLPDGVVKPVIVTGMEALGRGHDLNKLTTFNQALAPFGEAAMQYINMGDLITRIGTSLGIDMAGLVKSQEEIDQAMQQQQMMAMMQQGLTPGINAAGKLMQERMKQDGATQGAA